MNKEVFFNKCIVCSGVLPSENVNNILFFNCNFKIEGITDGKQNNSSGTTGKGKFITFTDEQPKELTQWSYLEVTATGL